MNSHIQDLKNYFDQIEKGVKEAYTLAEQARKKGHDPEEKVVSSSEGRYCKFVIRA